MTVEFFPNFLPDLVLLFFSVRVSSRRFRLICSCFASRFTSFVLELNTLYNLLLRNVTTASCNFGFPAFLNDQALTGFDLLVLIVDNHSFELVYLECFHEHFLLFLKLKLLLRSRWILFLSFVSRNRTHIHLLRGIENRNPNRILGRICPVNSMLCVSADINVISRVHIDASMLEG